MITEVGAGSEPGGGADEDLITFGATLVSSLQGQDMSLLLGELGTDSGSGVDPHPGSASGKG